MRLSPINDLQNVTVNHILTKPGILVLRTTVKNLSKQLVALCTVVTWFPRGPNRFAHAVNAY